MAPVIIYLVTANMAATPPTTMHTATAIRHNSIIRPVLNLSILLPYRSWIVGVMWSVNAFLEKGGGFEVLVRGNRI